MRATLLGLLLAAGLAGSCLACPLPRGGEAAVSQVIARTNAFRESKGRRPLSVSTALTRAAQDHACRMAATGRLSHTGANRSSVGDRARTVGYAYSLIAENIAHGQPGAAAVVDSWIRSRGHRRNIEHRRLREIGIGLATGGGGPYWVMVLGAPR